MASLDSKFSRFEKEVRGPLAQVPNSLTAVTSTDTEIFQIYVTNNSGATAQFTVTDTDGGYIIAPADLGDKASALFVFPEGLFCSNGVKWQASSATGVWAQIKGFKR